VVFIAAIIIIPLLSPGQDLPKVEIYSAFWHHHRHRRHRHRHQLKRKHLLPRTIKAVQATTSVEPGKWLRL